MRAAASLPLTSTSSAASDPRRLICSRASFRCSPLRRGGVARALDERLLKTAPPAPAEVEVKEETGATEVEGGGEWEGEQAAAAAGGRGSSSSMAKRYFKRRHT